MAHRTDSRSLSDSEVNERTFIQSNLEQQRMKRYSGSQLSCYKAVNEKPFILDARNSYEYSIMSSEISLNQEFDSEKNNAENFGGKKEHELQQEQFIKSDEVEFLQPETSCLQNTNFEHISGENKGNETGIFKVPTPLRDSYRPDINASTRTEKCYVQNIHQQDINLQLQEKENSTPNTQSSESSILYPILENPNDNFLMPSEDFIGEPRCVALKKYDDMDDALDLNLDEFDDEDELMNEQPLQNKNPNKSIPKKNVDDMFMDDDDLVEDKDSKSSTSKSNCWERSTAEKEEGELTPDLYSATHSDDGDSKNTKNKKHSGNSYGKKPERKESNQDFFLKINRCFRQLEREFCNMHVPRGSRRMIGQLQNTLCNVDRMKRRLTFLIDSAKNAGSERSKNSTNSKDDHHARGSPFDDKNKSKSSKTESVKTTSEILRETIRSHKEAEARMNRHLRRTAASIAYCGTKQEKQRIQSLFKRQMNMITQHVIQKKDPGKHPNTKAVDSHKKKDAEQASDGQKASEVTTLDEMEAFLAVLKVQKNQKDEIIAKDKQQKRQGPLRFTTKKRQPIVEKRQQPVLLVGANPPQVVPAQVQVSGATEETEFKKQVEVLKAMSDKRKEILKHKKDFEEVIILQEQLRKLTDMEIQKGGETSSELKSSENQSQNVKEHNVLAKEGKETFVTNTKFKKIDEIQMEKEKTVSISSKRHQKEAECTKPKIQSRSSDYEAEPDDIIPEKSKRCEKRKVEDAGENSGSETSKSDKEAKTPIPQKRKKTESGGKLSLHKKSSEWRKKSPRSRHRSNSEEATIIDGFDEKLPEELMSKKLLIVGDKSLALLNERFCLKVKGNQIYLKKVGRIKRAGKVRREQRIKRESNQSDWKIQKKNRTIDKVEEEEKEAASRSLEEMEGFLQELRSKKKVHSEEKDCIPKSNQPTREMKFMARIRAKRKAKLMACAATDITEKETKFLKDLENRARDPSDSPDTEKRKQELMQKIREETDAIVLQQKLADDDPLSDVKTFLNMLKEAESANDEKSKQFCVSFSMKKSEVRQLENIASGKDSALTEESQKFLNSVRAKMRAKKAPVTDFSEEKG